MFVFPWPFNRIIKYTLLSEYFVKVLRENLDINEYVSVIVIKLGLDINLAKDMGHQVNGSTGGSLVKL